MFIGAAGGSVSAICRIGAPNFRRNSDDRRNAVCRQMARAIFRFRE
jgi:hypothetical protein